MLILGFSELAKRNSSLSQYWLYQRRLATLQSGLQEVKHCHCRRLLLPSKNGWEHQLTKRHSNALNTWHQSQLVLIGMDDADYDKTTFTAHYGPFRFPNMTFEYPSVPGTFHRAINLILSPTRWQLVQLYHDAIIIISLYSNKHISHVCTALTLLLRPWVALNLKKVTFYIEKLDFLGHVIRSRREELADHITDAFPNSKLRHSVARSRSFLRLCSLYRMFVPFFRQSCTAQREAHKVQSKESWPFYSSGTRQVSDSIE